MWMVAYPWQQIRALAFSSTRRALASTLKQRSAVLLLRLSVSSSLEMANWNAKQGWDGAELFLQSGKYVVRKINNFGGSGAQEIAEFYTDSVGGNGEKFARSIVNKGKKVTQKVKCKISNLLGGSCGKSGGTPSSCGRWHWVCHQKISRTNASRYLQIASSLNLMERSTITEGIVCPPLMNALTFSSSYAKQMQSFWWFYKRSLLVQWVHAQHALWWHPGSGQQTPNVLSWKMRRLSSPGSQHPSTLQRSPLRGSELHFMVSQVRMDRFASKHLRLVPIWTKGVGVVATGKKSMFVAMMADVADDDATRMEPKRCGYTRKNQEMGKNYEKENGDAQFQRNCNR